LPPGRDDKCHQGAPILPIALAFSTTWNVARETLCDTDAIKVGLGKNVRA
jgi:hypothetical protein